MYTQCHRSTDTNKMPQKLYIAAGYWIRCVLGGEGASRPLPPTPHRRSHVHTVPSLHRHKQNATKVVHRSPLLDQVCAWGGGGKPPPPPNPPPKLKPSQAEPSQAKPSQLLFISQAPRAESPNSPPSLWPSQPDPTPAEPAVFNRFIVWH